MENIHLKKLLFRNTGIHLVGQAAGLLLGLATTFILSRYLGVERFGGLSYVFAFYYFFLVFLDMGIDTSVIRECSKNPARTALIVGTMRSYKLGMSFLLMFAAWILIWTIPYSAALRPALSLYALMLPLIAMGHISTAFQIHLNAKYPALIGLCKSVSQFILLISIAAAGFGMTGYIAALVLSEAVFLAAVYYFSKNFVKPVWTLDWTVCRSILKSGSILALMGLCVLVINRLDFIMLERMTDLHQVGLYAAVYKITSLFEAVPLTAMATLYPVMSRYAREDQRDRLRAIHKKSFLLFTALAVPLGVCVTLLAEPLIRIIFGAEYTLAAQGLRILIWATVFLYMAITSGNLLISLGREKISLAINLAAAGLNIFLNFLWIPRLGFVGAALATACSFALIFVCTVFSAFYVLRPVHGNRQAD